MESSKVKVSVCLAEILENIHHILRKGREINKLSKVVSSLPTWFKTFLDKYIADEESCTYMLHVYNNVRMMHKDMLDILASRDKIVEYMPYYKSHIPSTCSIYCEYVDKVKAYLEDIITK